MSTGKPTTYTELAAVLAQLPTLLREGRRARGLSARAAGRMLRFSDATIGRIERGEDCKVSSAAVILHWLDQAPPTTGYWSNGEELGIPANLADHAEPEASDTTECHCPPCPGRGNDGHGLTHCAECCYGTGVEAEFGCPTHNPVEASDTTEAGL